MDLNIKVSCAFIQLYIGKKKGLKNIHLKFALLCLLYVLRKAFLSLIGQKHLWYSHLSHMLVDLFMNFTRSVASSDRGTLDSPGGLNGALRPNPFIGDLRPGLVCCVVLVACFSAH